MATFTCISCRVAFKDADIQRQHYKTDWHRYNLKRKIADLPAVTAEEFQRRVLLQREKVEAESQEVSFYCEPCRKTFNSKNAYDNHLQAKKHKEICFSLPTAETGPVISRVKSEKPKDIESDESEIEEVDSEEWEGEGEGIPPTDCLFCPVHSASISKNLKHMSTVHSFFIPDLEFVVDLAGLLTYLGEKIGLGYMCLWCSEHGKSFWSTDATQRHMRDKGHCKVRHDGEALAEFVDFYDYSSSYPDKVEGEEDMEVDIQELDDSDYQLTLPSGVVIGHRNLMRYYRQHLDPNRAMVPRSSVMKYVAQYRAIGYTESTKEAIARKQKDLKFMRRAQAKLHMKIGVKANKLQTHFRQQVNF